MSMKRNASVALNIFLAIIVIWLLSSQLDMRQVQQTLFSINPLFLLLAAALYFCISLVNSARYVAICQKISHSKAGFLNFLRAHWAGIILSDVTPGRIGYAYFAVVMKRFGVTGAESTRLLGISLAVDFFVRAVCLILLGLFVAPALFGGNIFAGIIIAAVTFAIVAALVIKSRRMSAALLKIPFIGQKAHDAYEAIHSSSTDLKMILSSLAGSSVGTILRGAEWLVVFYCAAAVQMNAASLLVFSALVAVVTGLSFIPISIAGVGVQEGVGAALFAALFSIPFSSAAAAMLVCRAVELAVDSLGLAWVGK